MFQDFLKVLGYSGVTKQTKVPDPHWALKFCICENEDNNEQIDKILSGNAKNQRLANFLGKGPESKYL